jgi:hypothetical protein
MRRLIVAALACCVVILVAGLGVPLILHWRSNADRARCLDNFRRIGLIAGTPAGTVVGSAPRPEARLSWVTVLLPALGRADVAGWIDRSAPWDADVNARPGKTLVPQLVCPTFEGLATKGAYQPLTYPGIAGVGPDAPALPADDIRAGAFRYDAPTPAAAFRDGLSNCIVLLESGAQPNSWIAGGPPTVRPVDPATRPYLGPGRPFGGGHPFVTSAAFADGSARFLSDRIDPTVLELLAAITDGK